MGKTPAPGHRGPRIAFDHLTAHIAYDRVLAAETALTLGERPFAVGACVAVPAVIDLDAQDDVHGLFVVDHEVESFLMFNIAMLDVSLLVDGAELFIVSQAAGERTRGEAA